MLTRRLDGQVDVEIGLELVPAFELEAIALPEGTIQVRPSGRLPSDADFVWSGSCLDVAEFVSGEEPIVRIDPLKLAEGPCRLDASAELVSSIPAIARCVVDTRQFRTVFVDAETGGAS